MRVVQYECLQHADALPDCQGASQRRLRYSYTNANALPRRQGASQRRLWYSYANADAMPDCQGASRRRLRYSYANADTDQHADARRPRDAPQHQGWGLR